MIMAPPLSVMTIVILITGGGGIEGRQNPTNDNGAPLSIIIIVTNCGVWGGDALRGGGGAKILQKIMMPPLSVIKIVKYCGVGGGGLQNPTKDNGAPFLCHYDS